MRVGISVDNTLAMTNEHRQEWESRGSDPRLLNDDAFWATIPGFDDLKEAAEWTRKWQQDQYIPMQFWFFSERPESQKLITLSWLKRQGFKPDGLVMNSIKRFDARMNKMEYFIDTDPTWASWYRYDNIRMVLLDRSLDKSSYEPEGDFYKAHTLLRALDLCLGDLCG